MRKEIVFTGFGGQGMQTAGKSLGQALCKKGLSTSFIANYGPEVRGGLSSCQVVIKESPEDWPEVLAVNLLIAMSQGGYQMWMGKLSPESTVIYDDSLVNIASLPRVRQYSISATNIADRLGSRTTANMVMLGAVASVSGLLSMEEMIEATGEQIARVPLNRAAIENGYICGKMLVNK